MSTTPFGFGSNASGGSEKITVRNRDELAAALNSNIDGKIIELEENLYDFTALRSPNRKFMLHGERTTIRGKAGARVLLLNFQFLIDLDKKNRLILENIAFRSNGVAKGTPDGMDLVATFVSQDPPAVEERNSLFITHCSFDGYADISIDSHNVTGARRLLVTIDHCLFFDGNPGLYGVDDATFVNRGAINVDVERDTKKAPRVPGNSKFTVSNNVFIDVWRRSPRVAEDNFAHIYNNLLFRWGYTAPGSPLPGDGTWRGMEIGGGESRDTDRNGTAVIQANRFIPWEDKKRPADAINQHASTTVDYGGTAFPNQFDDPDGKVPASGSNPFPAGTPLSLNTFYGPEDIDVPVPTTASAMDWKALLEAVGPVVLRGIADTELFTRYGLPTPADPRGELRTKL